jgi:homocysteine S-methyltransferase
MYPAGPEYFGQYAQAFAQAGARLIGGCCGTTPEHIRAMHLALQDPLPVIEIEPEQSNGRGQVATASDPDIGSQLAAKIATGQFVFAVEMDPPRGLTTQKLIAGASLLGEAGADVINVADSPMARMRMSPWAVCDLVQRDLNIETTLHFPTRGRNLLRIQGDLLAAHAIGVRNVFIVMGDPTAIGDYPEAMDNFDLAPTGLIKLVKQGFNAGIDLAGSEIGQPTAFFVGAALNLTPKNPEREIKLLRRKLLNGADFFLTQPIYEPPLAQQFLQRYAAEYGQLKQPILAGVLPLYGVKHAAFLHNEVPGINIPDVTRARLEAAGKGSPREGVLIAGELIEEIKEWAAGVYLMPAFNRFDLVADIIEAVK